MFWIPITGAISEASGNIIERKILKKKKIDSRQFLLLEFFAILLVALPFLFFFWRIDSPAFEWKNILIFAFVIIMTVVANILVFYSMKREQLEELEPIRLLQPLFVILLAFIFFKSERDYLILVAGLVASLALIFSHVKRNHFRFNKYLLASLLGSFFFAVELVASNEILQYYSGLTFYFLRCLFAFLFALIIFRGEFRSAKKSNWLILIVGGIWVFYRVILYYGYLNYGVIFTTVLFILTPVFIYAFARIFLKEKLSWRNIVATIVILVCVIFVIWIKST